MVTSALNCYFVNVPGLFHCAILPLSDFTALQVLSNLFFASYC